MDSFGRSAAIASFVVVYLLGSAAAAAPDEGERVPEGAAVAATPATDEAAAAAAAPAEVTATETKTETETAAAAPAPHAAAPAAAKHALGATIALNQDSFFGFYPTIAGSYALRPRLHLAFYGILWTTPSFSFNAGGGGLWTEVGLGVDALLLDDKLSIRPQLGVLSGTLLSGSATPLVGEGVVPNLTVHYGGQVAEAEFYMGYYLAVRGDRQNDFIHYWANAGLKPLGFTRGAWASFWSVGMHWEHLRLQRTVGGEASDIYKWLGGYTQFTLPVGFALRFSGGADFGGAARGEFYKAAVVKSF
ncbi:MAG: hypothetical protein IPK80_14285 [Nannocystis sp.]|nr:hypothetical protein [Nannocystis sp.]